MILADEDHSKLADYPILPGVTAKLMQTKGWRSTVSVGCKHCVPNPRKSSTARVGNPVSDFPHA